MSVDLAAGTDRQVLSGNLTTGSLVSYGTWMLANTMGQNNSGALFAHGAAATGGFRIYFRFEGTAGSNKVWLRNDRATTNGLWEMTGGLPTPLARWRWIGLTYDMTSTANHPTFYVLNPGGAWSVLTNGAGLTRTSNPSGAVVADNKPLHWGNNEALNASFVGYLAHGCVYSRILTEGEMRLLAERGARRLPRDLLFSWPAVRAVSGVIKDERVALDGTLSGGGTVIATAEHPPARW